jgi:hypothetical protein
MKNLLLYLTVALMVVGAYAQSGSPVQKPESWNLTIVEALMYPGSSVQYNQTVISTYDYKSQCESFRRTIQTKFNTSAQCILKIKPKAKN